MKFTMSGFNQKKLIEFGLDLKDTALLRYFIDFKDTDSMSMIIVNNKPYYWVKYEALKEDLPILGIKSNVVLRRRLKKLEECGILEHYHKLKGGSFSYYGIGDNYKCLLSKVSSVKDFNNFQENIDATPQTEKFNPLNSKVEPLKPKSLTPQTKKFKQNNPSTKDKSTKDNNKKEKEKKTEFDMLIEEYTSNKNLKESLYEFIKFRKGIKAAMTTLSLKKNLNRLSQLAPEDDSLKIKIIDQTIMNGWKGLFPLSKDKVIKSITKNNKNSFNNFEGRQYDYDDLEKKLLGY